MPDDAPTHSAQLARYDGPRNTADLRAYALLLAGAENPRGMANAVLPAAFRGNPAALAFAVEYAKALDVAPVTAITGIHVIDGKPTASAGLISALVRRAGHRLRIWTEGSIDDLTLTGVATIVRHDDPDHEYRAEFSLADAERAELLSFRDGRIWSRTERGKRTQWEKYPRPMVKARALTEVAREAAEDALLGIRYTPEELGAELDDTGEPVYTVTQVPPAASSATAPAPAPAEEPPSLAELTDAVLTAVDVDRLRQLWRRAGHYNLIGADVSAHLDVTDLDALYNGEPPADVNLGSVIQAAGRYTAHHGRPVRTEKRQEAAQEPAEEAGEGSTAEEPAEAQTGADK